MTRMQFGFVLLMLAATAVRSVPAQSGGQFELRRERLGAGTTVATSDEYQLCATVAQADAGTTLAGADGYAVRTGFWATADASGDAIFHDSFEKRFKCR